MPRPREFDERHAVDSAMHAFWEHGYEATSTQQLCEATGLGRSSIYNTFGNKRALFRRSLQHYFDTATQAQIDVLEQEDDVREAFRTVLRRVVEDEFEHEHRGCLAVNTATELGERDREIAADLRRDADRYLEAMRVAIESAQRDGQVDGGKDALALARFLHATISGLRVASRAGTDRAAMHDIVEVALSTL